MSFHLMPASFTLTIPNSYWVLVWCATLPTVKCLSQWTPLLLAMRFPLLGLTQDFHPLDIAHAKRTQLASYLLRRDEAYIVKFRISKSYEIEIQFKTFLFC